MYVHVYVCIRERDRIYSICFQLQWERKTRYVERKRDNTQKPIETRGIENDKYLVRFTYSRRMENQLDGK